MFIKVTLSKNQNNHIYVEQLVDLIISNDVMQHDEGGSRLAQRMKSVESLRARRGSDEAVPGLNFAVNYSLVKVHSKFTDPLQT